MVWLIVLLRGRGCTRRAGDAARRAGEAVRWVMLRAAAGGASARLAGKAARRKGLRRGERGCGAAGGELRRCRCCAGGGAEAAARLL